MSTPALVDEPTSVPHACAAPSRMHGSASSEHAAPRRLPDWPSRSTPSRLSTLRAARHRLAAHAAELAQAISPALHRTTADTLVAEVLPLLAAIKFLEQQAATILKPRRLGRKHLPFWLAGVEATVERVPLGTVLIIGPANYPLLLPGVQALQALAAGNHVIWKPGRGGAAVAHRVADALFQSGLPSNALRITDASPEAAQSAITAGVDKIVFTGSAAAGRAVQRLAAETSTPIIAELSGCDAVFVLPGADPDLVLDALCFGMRLNGSATCMAPRRLFLIGDQPSLLERLRERFAAMEPVALDPATRTLLRDLLADAHAHGAEIAGEPGGPSIRPLLLLHGTPAMRIAQTDLFAPVLSVFHAATPEDALNLNRLCPLSLTASVFGQLHAAETFARHLTAGTILINDLIVPTADPRIPFGGRGASGFGLTRGAEGLLALTTVRTTSVRTSKSRHHLQPTTPAHEDFFAGIIAASHAGAWRARINGVRQVMQSATKLK